MDAHSASDLPDSGNGKWILLPAETPVREALCEALRVRSRTVLERVPPVVQEAAADDEHVHQLRVATRRLAAVVRVLKATAPEVSPDKLGRPLRKIRRLCGAARDLDVHQQFLARVTERFPDSPGLKVLLARGRRLRADLQAKLERRLPDLETKVRRRSEQLVARTWTVLAHLEGDADPQSLKDLTRQVLARELDRLRLSAAAWMEQAPVHAPTEDLHQLRIAGKKFRYASEIFAGALPDEFRERLYPRLQDMQSTLGDVQDAAASVRSLLEDRHDAEERLVMWLGLDSGHGSDAAGHLAGIDAAIGAYSELAAEARRTLSRTWNGFVHGEFFEPMKAMLA